MSKAYSRGPTETKNLKLSPNCFFYVNGDTFFPEKKKGPKRICISNRIKTFDKVKEELTDSLFKNHPHPGFVRSIFTPVGGSRINNRDELKDGEHYVASINDKFIPLAYSEIPEQSRITRHTGFKKIDYNRIFPPVEHAHEERLRKKSGRSVYLNDHRRGLRLRVHENGHNEKPAVAIKIPYTDRDDLEKIKRCIADDLNLLPLTRLMKIVGEGGSIENFEEVTDASMLSLDDHLLALTKASKHLQPKIYHFYGKKPISVATSPRSGQYYLFPAFGPVKDVQYKHNKTLNKHTPLPGIGSNNTTMSPLSNPRSVGGSHGKRQNRNEPKKGAKQIDYDKDEGGVYRAKGSNNAKGARQVNESKETRTERPIDQMEAEVVSEEEIVTKEKSPRNQPDTEPKTQPSKEKQNAENGKQTRAYEVNKNKNKGRNGADRAGNGDKYKATIGELPPIVDENETNDSKESNTKENNGRESKDSQTYRKEGDNTDGTIVQKGHVKENVEKYEELKRESTPNDLKTNGDAVQSNPPLSTTPPKGSSLGGADSASKRQERIDEDAGNQHLDEYEDDSFNQYDRHSSVPKNKDPRSSTPASRGEARQKRERQENEAAARIQAGARGYKTRKEFQAKKADMLLKEEHDRKQADYEAQERENNAREREQQEAREMEERDLKQKSKAMDEDVAASKIQASFKGYKTRKDMSIKKQQVRDESESRERDNLAATKIQSGFKGYQARKEYKYKKRPVQDEKDKEVVTDVNANEKKYTEDQAATKIQSNFKGYKTRKEIKLKRNAAKADKDKNVNEDKAATKIQAGYRGYKTRKNMAEQKKNKPDDTKVDDVMATKASKENAAATQIQAGIKGYKTRKEFSETKKNTEETKRKTEDAAATKIQASFKGFKSRQNIAEQKKQAQLPDPVSPKPDNDAEKAATKIQSGYRGYKARKEFKSKVIDTEDDESDVDQLPDSAVSRPSLKKGQFIEGSKGEMASNIQSAFRGYHARKIFIMEREKGESAQMKIIAAYRGHLSRKDYQDDKLKLEKKSQNEAAIKIQANYRGYRVRKMKIYPVSAVCRIQAAFRGYITRKLNRNKSQAYDRVLSVEGAEYYATLIQALCKGYITRHTIKIRRELSIQGPTKSNLGTDRSKKSDVSYWEDSNVKMYSDKTLRLAASYIQAAYQTFRVRKSHKEWKARQFKDKLIESPDKVKTDYSENEQIQAATQIQSCFRGYLVRKTLRNEREIENKSGEVKTENKERQSNEIEPDMVEGDTMSISKCEADESTQSLKHENNEKVTVLLKEDRNKEKSVVNEKIASVRETDSPCEVVIDGEAVTPRSRPPSGRKSSDSSRSLKHNRSSKRKSESAKGRPRSCEQGKDIAELDKNNQPNWFANVEVQQANERRESLRLESPKENRESSSAKSRTSSRPVSRATKRDSSGRKIKSKSGYVEDQIKAVNGQDEADLNISNEKSFMKSDDDIVTGGIVRTSTHCSGTEKSASVLSLSDVGKEKTSGSIETAKSKYTLRSSAKAQSSNGEVEREGDSAREIEDDAGELSSIEKNVTAISKLQAAFRAYKMRRDISELLSGGGELMDIRKIDRAVSALRKDFKLRSNKVRRLGSYQFGTGKKADWGQNWWEADELKNPYKDDAASAIQTAFRSYHSRQLNDILNKTMREGDLNLSDRSDKDHGTENLKMIKVDENDSLIESDGGESLNRSISETDMLIKKKANSKIEAAFRGYRTRETERKRIKAVIAKAEMKNANNKIKAAFRGYRTRQIERKKEKFGVTEIEGKQVNARIEAAYRGYRTRQTEIKRVIKSRSSTRSNKSVLHVEMHSDVINDRATKLQAAFAGHQTRKVFISLANMVEQDTTSNLNVVVQNLESMSSLSETDDFKLRHKSMAKLQAAFEAHKVNAKENTFRPKSGSVLGNPIGLPILSCSKSKTLPNLFKNSHQAKNSENLKGIEIFIKKKASATIIQSYARGFLMRKNYKNISKGVKEISDAQNLEVSQDAKTPLSRKSSRVSFKDSNNKAKEEMTEMVRVRTASVKMEAERRKAIAERLMLAKEASEATASVKKQAEKLKAEKGVGKRTLKSPDRMTPILSDRSDRGDAMIDKQNESAVKIQKHYRGYMVRKNFNKADRQKLLEDEYEMWKVKRIEAAVTIQSGWRGYQVRKELKEEDDVLPGEFELFEQPDLLVINIGRTKSEIERAEKRYENASMLQMVYRASKERRRFMVKMAVHRQDKHGAASKIQALVRGFLTRKRLKLIEHASRIQSIFKGYMSRENNKERKLRKLREQQKGATLLQAAYLSYQKRRENEHMKEERRKVIEMNQAAVDIQSGFRGFSVRKELAEKKAKLQRVAAGKIQSTMKGYQLRMKMREKKRAASVLISAYRSYKRRNDLKLYKEELDQKKVAATKLQSAYKGYVQRHKTRVLKEKRSKENKAATKIQCTINGRKARMEYKRRNKERQSAALKIQSVYRGHKGREIARHERHIAEIHDEAKHIIDMLFNRAMDYLERRSECAEGIQATFNGYCTRTNMANKLDAEAKEKHRSATHIQAIVRARQARNEQERKRQLVIEKEIKTKAATCIQAIVRARQARNEHERKRQLKIKKEIKRKTATCIQAVVRAKQGRGVLEERRQLVIQNAAATKIQSLFRGYSARKEMGREKAIISKLKPPIISARTRSGRLLELSMDGVLMKNARSIIIFHRKATELQDAFRASKTRREIQNRYIRKVKITETTPRREKSGKILSPEGRAAVMIQKTFRGYSDRKAYQFLIRDKRKLWNIAATRIQASLKGYRERCEGRQRKMRLKNEGRGEVLRKKQEAANVISCAYRSLKKRREKVELRAEM